MICIGFDTDIGMNRNSSDWFGMNSYPLLSPGLLQHVDFSKSVKFGIRRYTEEETFD